jgi:hypothetical protein
MQGYQRHTAIQGGHCPSALNPHPIGSRRDGADLWHCSLSVASTHQPELGRGRPAVPVSPGHVRPPHPYPPNRRRLR